LIEVETSLLASDYVHEIAKTMLVDLNGDAGNFPPQRATAGKQALQLAHVHVRAFVEGSTTSQLRQEFGQIIAPALGARSEKLNY
jgi:hypothetical protein